MALDAALPAFPRDRALTRALTAQVGLTLVVAASCTLRIVAAAAHPVPRYFPDEYLYAAIARALGTGHAPSVRGEPAHFPAILEPLLAAPFHALFSPELAYRLTQAENAVFMSLAAVPVFLLARRLSLASGYALACSVFTVAIPDFVFSGYTLADPVAFPLALGAVYAGVVAVQSPSRRAQIAFFALAGLATLARAQYVILPVAFLAAATLVDRRQIVRTQRLPLALCSLPLAGALALGPSHLLGYYSHVVDLHVGGPLVHWAVVDALLLGLSSGVVLLPGALIALARPRGRAETSFAAFAAVFAAGLFFEAALYASNGSERFQERYLFALLPLVPIAFGLYLKHGRPARLAAALGSLGFFALATRFPVSGYAAALGKTDSPFLSAVARLEQVLGDGNGALAVSLLAAAGALGAAAVSRFGGGKYALGGAVAVLAVTSLGATSYDAATAHQVRHDYLPSNPSWVDARGLHDVTLVQTAGSPPVGAVEQLYWNRSITREVLLGHAVATDVYAAPQLRIGRDGALAGVHGSVLFQRYGATARFQNARLTATAGPFALFAADETPRLGLLEEGRYADGWLGTAGRLTVWPDATGRTDGTLHFVLTVPAGAQATTIRFGKARYVIEPGRATGVSYRVRGRGPWAVAFVAERVHWLTDSRAVSVQSSAPEFFRSHAAAAQRATTSA